LEAYVERRALEQSTPYGRGPEIPIARVQAAELSPAEFREKFLEPKIPVVFEGFAGYGKHVSNTLAIGRDFRDGDISQPGHVFGRK
jgi:hypothetical protein